MFLRIIFIAEIVIATFFAIINVTYNNYLLSLILKIVCSLGFVLTSIFSVRFNKNQNLSLYAKAIITGQILSLGGDILLQVDLMNSTYFVFGLFSFVCAHFAYMVALCVKTKIEPLNIITSVILVVAFILCSVLCPAFDYKGLFPAISVYAIIILFMFSKSLSFFRFRETNTQFALFTIIGMFMTFAANFLITFVLFIPTSPVKLLSVMNLVCYYTGQECIALSLSCDDINVKRIE